MSKYKCIYNLNRKCLAVPQGLSCSEICYKAYQQGRADLLKSIRECAKHLGYDDIEDLLSYVEKEQNNE